MNIPTLYSLAAKTAENLPKAVVDEEGYSYVWAVVITGLSVVFLGLVILILFVWLMGKSFTAIENRENSRILAENKTAEPKKTPVPVKTAVKPSAANDDEIIAVISAAIAAMGEADGKKYKLKSVKAAKNKTARSPWAVAGLQSDTTPF